MCMTATTEALSCMVPLRAEGWLATCRLQPEESWTGEMILRLHARDNMV
jgi:hypothetical protein